MGDPNGWGPLRSEDEAEVDALRAELADAIDRMKDWEKERNRALALVDGLRQQAEDLRRQAREREEVTIRVGPGSDIYGLVGEQLEDEEFTYKDHPLPWRTEPATRVVAGAWVIRDARGDTVLTASETVCSFLVQIPALLRKVGELVAADEDTTAWRSS